MRHDRFAIASLLVCCTLAAGAAYAQNTAGAPGLSPTAELQEQSPTPMSGVQNNQSTMQAQNAANNSSQTQTTKKKKHKKTSTTNNGGTTSQPASGSTSG
jgi:membrane protease subunit (stomatin/prohibitin family)